MGVGRWLSGEELLLCKHEDLCADSQHLWKTGAMQESRGAAVLQCCREAEASSVSSRCSAVHVQGNKAEMAKKDTSILLWPTHTYELSYLYTHIYL